MFSAISQCYSSSSEKSGLNGDLNLDLCDACAVFHQLNHQINWELVVMWVDNKPVDAGYNVFTRV